MPKNRESNFYIKRTNTYFPNMGNYFYNLVSIKIPNVLENTTLGRTRYGLFLGMAMSVLMIVFLSWLAHNLIQEASVRVEAVSHTYRARIKNRDLLLALNDIETGQRGYLLTSKKQFLEPYYAGRSKLKRTQRELGLLIRDSPLQSLRLDTINYLVHRKMTLVEDGIKRTQAGLTVDMAALETGKKYMDRIRALSSKIENTERTLLSVRQNLQQKDDAGIHFYVLALSGVTLLFFLVFFRLLYLELRRRLGLQHSLESKVRELENLNAELEQFTYVASHDLQEPLRKIRAFAERVVLKETAPLREDTMISLSKISLSAQRMQQLIDDLLLFSRTSSARDQAFETIDLNQVMNDVQEELAELIDQKKGVFRLDELPNIDGIRFQIVQLFVNLFANALKYSKKSVAPVIQVYCEQVTGQEIPNIGELQALSTFHRISVSDNGIGFESSYSEKIFVIFQRLHTRSEYEGTGIGLALCRRIMNNHGGFITAEAKPNGAGAVFRLYFPT